MTDKPVKALVLTGFGINCDHETKYVFEQAGALADMVHINTLIEAAENGPVLDDYQVIAVAGGFSWADDHGAGVLLGLKLKSHLGGPISKFISDGKLIMGICNGFQALVNMGLLPGFDGDYNSRSVALTANDCGNFRNDWVHQTVNPDSPCVFTRGITAIDMPVRHGEGKFYAAPDVIERLNKSGQVVLRYADSGYNPAGGRFPYNPNGSLDDIAGICDETGRIFGLMPHPEAFHHFCNHPQWTHKLDQMKRKGQTPTDMAGDGLKIFKNAVKYVQENLL